MRECIYCGRSLEKGEQCTCAVSIAKRMAKEDGVPPKEETKKERAKKERVKKEKVKRPKVKREKVKTEAKNSFARAWQLFLAFMKSPVDTVMNPGEMSWATIIILTGAEGLILGLCASVLSAGKLNFIPQMTGSQNIIGYNLLINWTVAGISGIISGIALFFLYASIFFLVNRFVIRQFMPYKEFIKRFAFVAIPITVLSAISAVFGFFSITTFVILAITGLVGSVIITYEILGSLWYSKTPARIIYTMLLCEFVFLLILMNFIKFA